MSEESRTIAESRVTLSQFMRLEHANSVGNVHGGEIMKMVDEAGALAAMRHAHSFVVTVAMDSMVFMEPIYVGNLVTVEAELVYAGRTSIEVRCRVTKENPLTGERKLTNSAYVMYVALDAHGHPQPVPRLVATTPEEQTLMDEATRRQAERKRQRESETPFKDPQP
jgi:uncharacterized protein (TIGR00369 family)